MRLLLLFIIAGSALATERHLYTNVEIPYRTLWEVHFSYARINSAMIETYANRSNYSIILACYDRLQVNYSASISSCDRHCVLNKEIPVFVNNCSFLIIWADVIGLTESEALFLNTITIELDTVIPVPIIMSSSVVPSLTIPNTLGSPSVIMKTGNILGVTIGIIIGAVGLVAASISMFFIIRHYRNKRFQKN